MPSVADSGSKLNAISETHVTANEPIRNTRRGSLIVSQMPINAPSTRNPFNRKSALESLFKWIAFRMVGKNV